MFIRLSLPRKILLIFLTGIGVGKISGVKKGNFSNFELFFEIWIFLISYNFYLQKLTK